ncbi:MAG TPA: hypothetical protein VGF38_15120 [Ktedonobacterales bacterium]|jgi:hypothetical protein
MYGSNDNKPSVTRWETNPRVITGVVVVALGLVMLMATLTDSALVGQMVVLLLGVIFLAWGIAVRHPGPVIPGCILTGLGVGIVLSQWLSTSTSGQAQGGIVTLGLGLGFLLIMPVQQFVTRQTAHWWPLIPGGILSVTGLGLLLGDPELLWLGRLWPLALIGVGIALLYQAVRSQRKGSDVRPLVTPPPPSLVTDAVAPEEQKSGTQEPVTVS